MTYVKLTAKGEGYFQRGSEGYAWTPIRRRVTLAEWEAARSEGWLMLLGAHRHCPIAGTLSDEEWRLWSVGFGCDLDRFDWEMVEEPL